MSRERILITGGGGREHAIGWKLSQSSSVGELFFSPSNAGTEKLGDELSVDFGSPISILNAVRKNRIDRVIVGPESHLFLGVTDLLDKEGIPTFGPTKKAAKLETDKAWAVEFMDRHNIPHPNTFIPNDYISAKQMAILRNPEDIVIKVTGPAEGKGVLLPKSKSEALDFVNSVYLDKKFGENQRVIIQQKISGKEISFLVFSDGIHTVPLLPAKDYKRIGNNDTGPNTGGMGAYAPREMSGKLLNEAMEDIVHPTVQGMMNEHTPFRGVLYVGLMNTGDGLKVIEYNARFGDPETQVLMMLLDSDLLQIAKAIDTKTLTEDMVKFNDGSAVCTILAAPGYPSSQITGQTIYGLEAIDNPNVQVFHANTKNKNGRTVTNGGRVLGVTGFGPTKQSAREASIEGANKIIFEGKQMRTDIGI